MYVNCVVNKLTFLLSPITDKNGLALTTCQCLMTMIYLMLRATRRSCRERFRLDKLKMKEIQRKYDVHESCVLTFYSYI